MVVVDGAPVEHRPVIEETLTEYFVQDTPELHLMEKEGYRSLMALLPDEHGIPEEVYRASALPSAMGQAGRQLIEKRRRQAREGLEVAGKRLSLAQLVLKGGFPEELLRPIREALGWGLSSLLRLFDEVDPSPALPSPREIQSALVEKGHLPEDLAMRLARVRELTEPPAENETTPAPSLKAGEAMISSVQSLIELGQQKEVGLGL